MTKIQNLLAALLLMLGLQACTLETSDNGVLDGFWQLASVDTLATGRSTDVRPMRLYWSVQARLLEMRRASESHGAILFRFERQAGQLVLHDPVRTDRVIGDSLITDVESVAPYGLTRLPDTLAIERLNGDGMTLRGQAFRLHFRKY